MNIKGNDLLGKSGERNISLDDFEKVFRLITTNHVA